MKKLISVLTVMAMTLACLSACGPQTTTSEIIIEEGSDYVSNDGSEATGEDGNTSEDGTSSSGSGTTSSGKTTANQSAATTDDRYAFMKGQTYTMAITPEPQYKTTSFKKQISDFQKKYGCTIKTVELVFNDYNKMVTQQMATGDPYDICFMHGSMFIPGSVGTIYEDMTSALTQVDSSNLKSDWSNYFKDGSKLYAVCHAGSAYPIVMFYNKVMFEEYGLEDPLTLYKHGKWTWDKIKEIGKEVTDKDNDIYFLSQNWINLPTATNGTTGITMENGKVVCYLNSKEYYQALTNMKELYYGNDAIAKTMVASDWTDEGFSKGTIFTFVQESAKYSQIAGEISGSAAFGKKVDNLGLVPLPKNDNGKVNTGWLFGVAAGKGSDPRVAVAWANYAATYKSPSKGKTEMSDELEEVCKSLLTGKTVFAHTGLTAVNPRTNTSNLITGVLTENVSWAAGRGSDISKAISDIAPVIKEGLDNALGKGNYVMAN